MPYPKQKTWEISLDELDADCSELTIALKEPASLPASTSATIAKAQAVFSRIQKEAKKGDKGQPIAREDEWALTAPQTILSAALVSWNLPYPDDYPDVSKRGQVIPLHDASEPDPLGVIPTEVYQFILGKVMVRLLTPSKSAQG